MFDSIEHCEASLSHSQTWGGVVVVVVQIKKKKKKSPGMQASLISCSLCSFV